MTGTEKWSAILTEDEVAAILRISRRRLLDWLRRHPDAPHLRLGRTRRFTHDDVVRIMSMMRQDGAPTRGRRLTSRPASAGRRRPEDAVAAALALAGGERIVPLATGRVSRRRADRGS